MRLTTAILSKLKLPNGHIFRGKNRLVKLVTDEALTQMQWDYEIEEQNMLLLRHPYLTVEQSSGHKKALRNGKPKVDWQEEKIKKFSKCVTLEDRLMHLKVRDAWD